MLASFGVKVERVRTQIVRIVGQGEEFRGGALPFTGNAKRALERSAREADGLGHQLISTEHILLGLLDGRDGIAARVLRDYDADLENIRNGLSQMIAALPKWAREASGRPRRDEGEGLQTNTVSERPPPRKITRRRVYLRTSECERGQRYS